MSSQEEVERKVDGEAEGEPGNRRLARGENDDAGLPEDPGSAVGGLLTDTSLGVDVVAPISLAVLLFGGLVLVVAGATLWVADTYGLYATMVVLGSGGVLFAYLLAQVYARRGWI